jgi:hypothetical protein
MIKKDFVHNENIEQIKKDSTQLNSTQLNSRDKTGPKTQIGAKKGTLQKIGVSLFFTGKNALPKKHAKSYTTILYVNP